LETLSFSGDKMNQKTPDLCGMLVPSAYIFMYLLGRALRPGYSQITHSVSELLSPGSPNKKLLDIINLTPAVLYTLFGIGVFRFGIASEQNALVGRIGAGLIIAVGIASIGSAIFPQDATGTPQLPCRVFCTWYSYSRFKSPELSCSPS